MTGISKNQFGNKRQMKPWEMVVFGAVFVGVLVFLFINFSPQPPKTAQERYEDCMETGAIIGEVGVAQEILCRVGNP